MRPFAHYVLLFFVLPVLRQQVAPLLRVYFHVLLRFCLGVLQGPLLLLCRRLMGSLLLGQQTVQAAYCFFVQFLLPQVLSGPRVVMPRGRSVKNVKVLDFHVNIDFLALGIGRGHSLLAARSAVASILPLSRIPRRYNFLGVVMRLLGGGGKELILGELEIFLAEIVAYFGERFGLEFLAGGGVGDE